MEARKLTDSFILKFDTFKIFEFRGCVLFTFNNLLTIKNIWLLKFEYHSLKPSFVLHFRKYLINTKKRNALEKEMLSYTFDSLDHMLIFSMKTFQRSEFLFLGT